MEREQEILLATEKLQLKKAVVECGHFYTGKPFDEGQEFGVGIGLNIAQQLEVAGLTVEKWLFVDDFHGAATEYSAEIGQLANWSFEPNKIVSEAEQTGLALVLHDLLRLRGVIEPGQIDLPWWQGGVRLIYNHSQYTNPSCELIDASLYIEKLGPNKDRLCVTVLPDFYKEQQEKTRKILRAYGLFKPLIMVIYFDVESGILTEINNWWEEGEHG